MNLGAVNVLAGYVLAWFVHTPEGKKLAVKAGRTAMRKMAECERAIFNAWPKGSQTDEREEARDETHLRDEEISRR